MALSHRFRTIGVVRRGEQHQQGRQGGGHALEVDLPLLVLLLVLDGDRDVNNLPGNRTARCSSLDQV